MEKKPLCKADLITYFLLQCQFLLSTGNLHQDAVMKGSKKMTEFPSQRAI